MEITDLEKEEILKLSNKDGAYEFGRQKGYRYGFTQGAEAERRKNEEAGGVKELQHYQDSSIGLWCVDKDPANETIEWIRKNAFQLKNTLQVTA